MELPSMVQRSGDTLIVRSVVSGNQLYLDQGANSANSNTNNTSNTHAHSPSPNHSLQHHHSNSSTIALEQQLERYRAAAAQQQQHYLQQQQQQNANQQQQAAALELKDEGLPQCKIKRNYSCSYCTYFTQNPRYHLTHLRDVHGEKIVINKCKLCLYASRHFQKLVRHMKMVHGCTDGIAGAHGQARGKRGMSREARKRKLEQSVGIGSGGLVAGANAGAIGSSVSEMPTFEQVKRELELQEQKLQLQAQSYNKQQEAEQKHQQQLANNAAIFAAAYERQLQAQRDRDLEAQQARSAYEQNASAAEAVQRRHSPPTQNNSSIGFQMPPAHQPQIANRNLDLTPSPTGSSSPSNRGTPLSSVNVTGAVSGGALSLSYAVDEPAQNRLLKCSICDFTTLYRADLVDHERQDHGKTKFFRCEKCSYVTHIKARFSKHVKYHSMPMIKCVTCDFRTPYKWNLDRHMKNHGGAGPFKCAACDFTADIKQSLTVHEMNHHVPPVGHAAGMSLARRRNKVGGTDLCDDFLSDSAELLEDHYNNNNLDEYDEALLVGVGAEVVPYGKKCKYDDDEPTDLSQKGGSSDTSSVHNHSLNALTPKAKRPVPNLIPIPKVGSNVLNLSKDLAASRSSLSEIASIFFNEKQLSEMLQPLDKSDAAQLSPTTTITSTTSSHNSRSLLQKRTAPSFFDKLKSSALASGGPNENLICPCGHVAKCLSESIIHRKTCNFAAIADDDIEEEQDETDDRLEIDFADEEDKQSHSALNLSVTGSTRCQHCRHRCKSSADLINHLKQCSEAGRCGNESYDSLSGESSAGRAGADSMGGDQQHPMENRVFIWNKMPRSGGAGAGREGSHSSESGQQGHSGGGGDSAGGSGAGSASNEENSYYGVETAPGYGEVTKKMTPEEEAANSSLKKVYKCPHCSFWASTASRFHVHIVGHLNKKPFECSLCSYRSNWRWDITKHIRLKTIRDPSHKNARVLMNDETGRRNYTKYNKYITLMKVTEEDGDPKLMKSGEMTPNQVASLAFLNDFNKSVNGTSAGSTSSAHLNGNKEDITLEAIVPNKSATDAGGAGAENQLSEGFIRLPILATMMNAAMVQQQQQQQHQKEHDQQHTTMITPSVTISAVKRSPPPLMKPSDDLVTDVRQEGNEKKTFYKCRKCNFRHTNRDAVLAHVKIHYQDPNYPIITATATPSPNPSSTTALQVAVNSTNMYMNKVLAAMCLSQQQQNSNSSSNNHQQQQHSILSAGLLQQAIQGASPNSPLGGLALALAGKSPAKAATASILEHGEQKANQNEASAQRPPASPTIVNNNNSNKNNNAACLSSSVLLLSGGSLLNNVNNNSSSGMVVGVPSQQQQPPPPPSLQHLLTSPRGTYAITQQHTHHNHQQQQQHQTNSSTTFAGVGTTNNNNSNLVMGGGSHLVGPGTAATTTATAFKSPTAAALPTSSSSPSSLLNCTTATSTIVTTISNTSTTTTTTNSCNHNLQMGIIGGVSSSLSSSVIVGASKSNINNNNNYNQNQNQISKNIIIGGGSGGENVCIGGVIYGSNNSTLNCNITSTSAPSHLSSSATTATTNSSNLLLSSAPSNATTANRNASSSSSPPSSSSSATNLNINSNNNNNNSNSNNNNCNLLSNDNDRRDPSPYRCGHCHQVSNWKHVIQRHCRLKHAGDIRIETLDRSAINERGQSACIYRPLGNSGGGGSCGVSGVGGGGGNISSNETNYGLTLKALQQHQQQHQQSSLNNNNNNISNNNSVLISKNEHLQHSPIAAATAAAASATAANTPHDLQAAAHAYLAAAYKVAAANVGGAVGVGAATATGVGEDMLLQQQLQQNDQIEITRLPATTTQQNSKCKQQKCPLCPYISESKSQMNYHISLHKPTQYDCPLCTFVCAKKQHLSSHMRSVHQQHNSGGAAVSAGVSAGVSAAAGGINVDFSAALQFAAAAQAQQETSSSTLPTPLAIDLTNLKHFSNASHLIAQQLQQRLQNEHQSQNQTKIVYHCAKCPVRFAQKHHNDEASIRSNAKAELEGHLKFHHGLNGTMYKCEFCDFKAAHETSIQTHRHVHTQHYQDKCKELYRMCKESVEYTAPKLMQITLAKNLQTQTPETIWIVDNELTDEQIKQQQQQQQLHNQHHQQQNSSISSSSAGASNFDNANSLLKKQLESGPAPLSAAATAATAAATSRNSPSPKVLLQECNDDSSNTHSTSASIATSDLAADLAGSDIASSVASPAPSLEKCLHCPYETTNSSSYKSHLQHHICVSNQREAFTCEHCDYTEADKCNIEEHTRLHFNAMEKLKSVAFFTKYDNLELSIEHDEDDEDDREDVGEEIEKATAQVECNENECEEQQQTLNIKQEEEHCNKHNNNNEEHVLNENTLQEEQQQQQKETSKALDECEETSNSASVAMATAPLPPPTESIKKIILYKNDGCLSIKRDTSSTAATTSASAPTNGDNISDRLRRRISRSSNNNNHMNANNNNNNNDDHHNHNQQQQNQPQQQQQQSHKTILVNAKTGQVISRN